MDVEINYVAVLVATIAAMAIGGIWYSKPVFGKVWMELVSLDEEKAKKSMPVAMLIMLVGAFIKAYFLATFVYLAHNFYDHSYLHDGLGTAFAVWLGFVFVQVVSRNVFEQSPPKLTAIILGNELITMLAMGAIIGAMGV